MAIVRYTWTKYNFIPNEINDEPTYNLVKTFIKPDDRKNYFKTKNFKDFLKEFSFQIIGFIILGFLVGIIIFIFDKPKNYENIYVPPLIGFMLWFLFGGIQSMTSYLAFMAKNNYYYKRLLKDVEESTDYNSFLFLRKRRGNFLKIINSDKTKKKNK